jgi:hypothetical protein
VYQKTWISNKDNFALLAFNRNPLADSRRTDMKIAQLATLRLKSHLPQLFVLLYHLFPDEADEPPSSGYYNIFLS